MTALAATVVVMPTWVFMLFLLGGIAVITFLLWANDTQAHDLRRARRQRQVHDHLHHDGPKPVSLIGDQA